MRRNDIDNLRWICILLLFPYHAAMIFNCWGEGFYVRGVSSESLSAFIIACYTWFMPLLFALAGVSSHYALQKRTAGEYVKERFKKLFIPFLLGVLLIVPAQTYFAERMHNAYTGGYFAQYSLFFGKFGDLSGYTGGFTVGHLWFLLYLFVISLLTLPLMRWYLRKEQKIDGARLPLGLVFVFSLATVLLSPLSIAGKSIGLYTGSFLLGFFLLSNDALVDRLARRALPLSIATLVLIAAKLLFYFLFGLRRGIASDLFDALLMAVAIPSLFGAGRRVLGGTSPVSRWLGANSFAVYILHQSVLVSVGYAVLQRVTAAGWQFVWIILLSLPLTLLAVWLVGRVPYLRMLIGVYEKPRKSSAP